jgi:serine phosphatase RsbU (regulator of sigma subunit)
MPLIHFHDGKLIDYKPKGIGIGLTKDPAFFSHNLEDMSVQLSEGDMCLLYTDGLIELFEDEHQFHEFCNEHCKDAHLFIQAIEALISGNTHTSLRDDVTVISFKRIQA